MPTLADLLARMSFLASTPAVVGVFITAALLVASRDWRVNVIALATQYLFVVLLMTRLIRLEMAAVKGLIGWVICLMFYLTERQARSLIQSSSDDTIASLRYWQRWKMSARASFGLLAAVLMIVAAYTAAFAFPLPVVSTNITLVCYALTGLGILLLGLSKKPLQVGLGLLTFLSGFDLFYVAVEPSLVVTGLLGAISFVIALAMAYLRAAEAAASEGGEAA